MTTVKTAISIDDLWFQRAEQMAAEMKISRSHLFLLALQQLFEEYESRKMIEKVNEVYANESVQAETREMALRMRAQQRKLVEDAW